MSRRRIAVLIAAALAADVLLLLFQLANVLGNLEAEVILGTWQTVLPIAWLKRHADRRHAEQVGRLEANAAQTAAHQQALEAVAAHVGELHDLHVHGRWPEDRHQAR